jgi:hypothetical protein
LDLDLNKKDKLSDKVTDEFQDKIDYYSKNIKRYKAEKDSIQIVAKGFEDARDENKKHSEVFGIAVIFLQVSILLSSISALLKKKYIWLLSLCIAAVGIFYFIDGFLLFYLV